MLIWTCGSLQLNLAVIFFCFRTFLDLLVCNLNFARFIYWFVYGIVVCTLRFLKDYF